jgi:hypothetical protein
MIFEVTAAIGVLAGLEATLKALAELRVDVRALAGRRHHDV